ncbi:low molecular weight protein arginine phosphatase [Listeria grandensis]|uniref:low molecular weight protein arginine phosphatase n=1 Tax=Listeria grandensis TaxID=1494963 RepID=UPI00164E2555|nr:low molecular weight protein arginine phosphatase [Listeria grandensis]MBC6315855.1 low molecular weight protein arginine phosphatase [Listeria grandensis]
MNILFVCTGNTCRSPMAEKMLQWFKPDWKITSAGLAAQSGSPMSAESKAVLQEHGLPTYHVAKSLTNDLVDQADKIFVMTEQHRQALLYQFPNQKTELISPYDFDVADPYGGSKADYEYTFAELEEMIARRFLLDV